MLVIVDNVVVVVLLMVDGVCMVCMFILNGLDEYVMMMDGVVVVDCDILVDVVVYWVNQLVLVVMGVYVDGLVVGVLWLIVDYVVNWKQFGKLLLIFQIVVVQFVEVYIVLCIIDLVVKLVIWRLVEDLDVGDDLGVFGYWVILQVLLVM